MGFKGIDPQDAPAIRIVEARLREFYPDIRISEVARNFDQEKYCFRLIGTANRNGDLVINRTLLDDLRDNPDNPTTKYSIEITRKLDASIHQTVELCGLIGFNLATLEFIFLRFVAKEWRSGRPVNKYNAIGRGAHGELERAMNITLDQSEKETIIWAWGDLLRTRLIVPTGTDLVAPDDWVKPTELGNSFASESSLVEFKNRLASITNENAVKPLREIAVESENSDEQEILDDLLPISPRREYTRKLPKLCSEANAEKPLSLMMIDIDHFKKFNDTHGHSTGDRVLILVSTKIKDAVAGKGYVFRCGGEEIVVLLPNHEPVSEIRTAR